jgi:hypothetical protein
MHIAVVTFFLIILVTFVGTWEQKEHGLYDCQHWYFDSWVTPREGFLWGWLPLPGMVLLLTVMFCNVLAGGIIRLRKNKRTIGVVISHLSILGFIVSGGISLWHKTEGHMIVNEGGQSNVVADIAKWVVEVRELPGPKGEAPASQTIDFFPSDQFVDLEARKQRTFFKTSWPFELRASGYVKNATVVPASDPALNAEAPRHGEYALKETPYDHQNQVAVPGLRLEAVDRSGNSVMTGLVIGTPPQPITFAVGERRFMASLTRERWETPFTVKLDDFRAEFYPGTSKAIAYESDITVIHEGGRESKHLIEMNKPLRDSGYIAFQTSYDQESPRGQEKYSVFTVVKNPSDQGPLYSLLVCTLGLLIHFGVKLTSFLQRPAKSSAL